MNARQSPLFYASWLRLGRIFFAAIIALGALSVAIAGERETAYPAPHYTQKIGAQLPLDLSFTDDSGKTVTLGDFTGKDPIVLLFGYWHCPQLCSVVSASAVDALRQLRSQADNQFTFVYLSIDKSDTTREAAAAKATDLRHFTHDNAADRWHYLIGSEANVRAFATAAGFEYRFDEVAKQYVHPAGLVVLSPQGKVSQYFLGVDFRANDLASALHTARQERPGSAVFDLVLLCFRGDGVAGRYGKIIWHILQFSVAATVLALGFGITRLLRHEKTSAAKHIFP